MTNTRGRRPSARPHSPRRALLSIAACAAVIGTAGFAPASNATPAAPAQQPAVPAAGYGHPERPSLGAPIDQRVVRLITGDDVRVLTYRDGTTRAAVLPGSPHAGQPYVSFATQSGRVLRPRLPIAVMGRLDTSVFNVTALAALDGARAAIVVRFAAGVRPHDIAGLTMNLGASKRVADGTTTVPATYGAAFGGLNERTMTGVESITLPAGRTTQLTPGLPTHTLTIRLRTSIGAPADFGITYIVNVDDARRYLATPYIKHGQVKVDVPEGHYGVIVYTFAKLVERPEVTVLDDTSVTLNLGNATVHPHVSVPGFHQVDTQYSISRLAERNYGFPLIFEGPRFFMRIQPHSGRVPHGTFSSGVTATLLPNGRPADQPSPVVAVTGDVRPGVPTSLTFTHARSDFASVTQHFRSNGPAGPRLANVAVGARNLDLQSFLELPVQVPGERTFLAQANPRLYFSQEFEPTTTPEQFFGPSLWKTSRYAQPDEAPGVSFAYGPVGPGPEARFDHQSVGRYCSLCRFGVDLNGGFTLWNGAGAAMFGFLGSGDANWSLRHAGQVLASGGSFMTIHRALPPGPQTYQLIAAAHPQSSLWQLSTNVRDVWTFQSQAGRAVIPILLASYLPHTTPLGTMAPGHTTFRLDFGNLGPVRSVVRAAHVSLSVDSGQHWTSATVTRLGPTSFRVGYDNPASVGVHRFISLRVSGLDAGGRQVTETAIRAYRLVP